MTSVIRPGRRLPWFRSALALGAVSLAALVTVTLLPGPAHAATLKQLFPSDRFYIGAAVNSTRLGTAAYRSLVDAEFSSVTAANEMKWDATEPARNQYNFVRADQIAAYVRDNGKVLRGHTLVWHSQLPAWVQSVKTDALYELVRGLKAQGVPIDGVALQGHFALGQVPTTLGATINRFAGLGVDVRISQLDVRIQMPADSVELNQQGNDYLRVLQACLAVSRCKGVTMSAVSDADSFLPSTYPGFGAAMLFDAQLQPKPAYSAIVNGLLPKDPTPSTPTSAAPVTSAPPATTAAPSVCSATYRIVAQWPGGFQGEVTVRNTSATVLNGWTVRWTPAPGQTIQPPWGVIIVPGGPEVIIRNPPSSPTLPVNGSFSFGFLGTWTGSNPIPTVHCTSP